MDVDRPTADRASVPVSDHAACAPRGAGCKVVRIRRSSMPASRRSAPPSAAAANCRTRRRTASTACAPWSARAIAQSGNAGGGHALASKESRALYAPIDPVESLSNEEKIALLREVDQFARSLDPLVSQVIVSISAALDTVIDEVCGDN